MKALLIIFALTGGSVDCLANNTEIVAFERFSHELAKANSSADRSVALFQYAEDLYRTDTYPSSWGECLSSVGIGNGALNGCEPFRPVIARIGGTGGVE
jgi:hypothetical protein